tara:strand:+ start:506 stop:1816 length:1311 start_codon:yes stop_codon:yes gene_type:complete
MRICWNELPQLQNIMSHIKPEEEEDFRLSQDYYDLKETIWIFIDDHIKNNITIYKDKHFNDILRDNIYESMFCCYYEIFNQLELKINIDELIEEIIQTYFIVNNNPRSYKNTFIHHLPNVEKIDKLLKYYEKQEQPDQRTDEWYKFRYMGLTASTIYKAIDSQANKNSLIYEKCQPIKIRSNSVNINSAFHNGHKYEPLSIMLYESWYDTQVGEFGCIKHKDHDFLRASPDGINIKRDNPRYGRALEIKNPVSRQLTGIPKKEYWVQMQLQMEVWDLDECDFFETIFQEYETEEDFLNAGSQFNKTKNNKHKGVIIMFNDGEKPLYEYCPVNYNKEQFDKWYDEIMELHENHSWINNIYWYLQDYSCVLCPRNKKWFNAVFPELQELWNTILNERKTGYDHRKPRKNNKKIKKKDSPVQILKIPTQSFDETDQLSI